MLAKNLIFGEHFYLFHYPFCIMKLPVSPAKLPAQRGFTLVEIAIVMVLVGVLIAAILRGQELIASGRVSAIAAQQSAIKTAYFGFIDRYKAQPGDLTAAQAGMVSSRTAPASVAGDGNVLLVDSAAFFNNLSEAGYISCASCASTSIVTTGAAGSAATYTPPSALSSANTLTNVFAAPLAFLLDTGASSGGVGASGSSTLGSIYFLATSAENAKPLLTTGGGIGSAVLAELDRKSDDGSASGGMLRYTDISAINSLNAPFVSPALANGCITASVAKGFIWAVNPTSSCQGASLL